MNDMSQVIVPKSDQINADDLIAGPLTITISDVQIRGGQEQPVSIFFAGSDKAFRPCKSMSRVLVAAWGPDAKLYVGRSLTLYRDPSVKWGGLEVGGIRISHMTHLEAPMTMALTATKGSRKPYTVRPLLAEVKKIADPNAAQKWVDDHLGFVAGAMTTERLAEVQELGKKAMAKLVTSNPDLHQKVTDAYAARLAAITVDFEPETGREDAAHGDQFDGDTE
jgi:hypothetical protein